MTSPQSPFDAIKQVRDDGTEFWSARDLMRVMGYTEWRNFHRAILRTSKVLAAHGVDVEAHAILSTRAIAIGSGAVRNVVDYDISMFYLTVLAMFCGGDSTHQIVTARLTLAAGVSGAHDALVSLQAPPNIDARGYVYVVEGSNGYVKVGRSVRPEARIYRHRAYLKSIGASVRRTHVSGEVIGAREAEREVIRVCAEKGIMVANTAEWYTGVPFDYAVASVNTVTERLKTIA